MKDVIDIIGILAIVAAFWLAGVLVGHACLHLDKSARERRRDMLKRAEEAHNKRVDRQAAAYARERALRDQFDRESA